MKKRLVVGLSGASGAILCVSLLEAMRREKDWEVHLVTSEASERVLHEETGMSGTDLAGLAFRTHDIGNIGAAIAGKRERWIIQGHFGSTWQDGQYVRTRDMDKVKACGLTVRWGAGDAPFFDEAEWVLVCRKLYAQDMDPACVLGEGEILPFYTPGQGGWHRIYVGQVVEAYQK